MFMIARRAAECNKDWRSTLDISEATGMEVEHGHDTQNVMLHRHGVHINVKDTKNWQDKITKEFGALRAKAQL